MTPPPDYATWPVEKRNSYMAGETRAVRKARAPHSNELVTEDSAALEFARLYADRLRFDHDVGRWREWTGSIWRENKTCLALHFAREMARDLGENEPDKVRYVTSKISFAGAVEKSGAR